MRYCKQTKRYYLNEFFIQCGGLYLSGLKPEVLTMIIERVEADNTSEAIRLKAYRAVKRLGEIQTVNALLKTVGSGKRLSDLYLELKEKIGIAA